MDSLISLIFSFGNFSHDSLLELTEARKGLLIGGKVHLDLSLLSSASGRTGSNVSTSCWGRTGSNSTRSGTDHVSVEVGDG